MYDVEEASLIRYDGELELVTDFEISFSRIYSLSHPAVATH